MTSNLSVNCGLFVAETIEIMGVISETRNMCGACTYIVACAKPSHDTDRLAHVTWILVFSKCVCTGFGAFSKFKNTVKGGKNACNLCVIIKFKNDLIFLGGVMVHSVCHY